MKHIIWSSEIDFDDYWKENLKEEYPESSDDELYKLAIEINNDYFDDELFNLDKELGRPIVMYGSLGLWNGRRSGYKFIKGTNLNNCLSGAVGDYTTWFEEDGELQCEDIHHDGTNHYTYRILKEEIDPSDFEEYVFDESLEKAVEDMTEPLGHYIVEIYGY